MILFIIIYGTYGITYSKGQGGQFACPCCSSHQAYRHRRVRRFFHIFFVPLIPLNLAGEYVECGQCRGTFKLEVLEASRALTAGMMGGGVKGRQISEAQRGVRRVLAMMTLADGKVDESEIAAIGNYLTHAEQRPITRDEVVAELDAAQREATDVEAFCRQLMGFLNEQGRQEVLRAAHMVASADGHVDPNEQRLLERLGIALGMKPAQVSSSLGAPAQQQRRPAAPFCPRCGAPGRWIAEHNCWGCDHCRQPIQ